MANSIEQFAADQQWQLSARVQVSPLFEQNGLFEQILSFPTPSIDDRAGLDEQSSVPETAEAGSSQADTSDDGAASAATDEEPDRQHDQDSETNADSANTLAANIPGIDVIPENETAAQSDTTPDTEDLTVLDTEDVTQPIVDEQELEVQQITGHEENTSKTAAKTSPDSDSIASVAKLQEPTDDLANEIAAISTEEKAKSTGQTEVLEPDAAIATDHLGDADGEESELRHPVQTEESVGRSKAQVDDGQLEQSSKTAPQRRAKWYENQDQSQVYAKLDASASGPASSTSNLTTDSLTVAEPQVVTTSATNSTDSSPAPNDLASAAEQLLQTTATVHNITLPVDDLTRGTRMAASSDSGTDGVESQSAPPAVGRAGRSADKTAQGVGRSEADQANPLSQHERARLVQRISRSFARLGPTGGQINLRLHPPQLGALNVQVRLEGQSMTAKLTTETSAAREVILESLPVLRGRLAEQGFDISQFQVDVAENNADANLGGNNSSADFNRPDGGPRQQPVDHRRRVPAADSDSNNTSEIAGSSASLVSSSGIDVHA